MLMFYMTVHTIFSAKCLFTKWAGGAGASMMNIFNVTNLLITPVEAPKLLLH